MSSDLHLPADDDRDNDAFQQLTDGYRYELLVHCYRILGSLEDAEDALQDTLLRAWRRLESLREQHAVRAWLYRIATNVALDMLRTRKSRLLPTVTHKPAKLEAGFSTSPQEIPWLDPLPETYATEYQTSPEASYEALESITLAFLTALQQLPGNQRVALLLCDVLDWKVQEAADLLDLTVSAVNSALQRARSTLKNRQGNPRDMQKSPSAIKMDLLQRYVQAWETADPSKLLAVLLDDAALTMPPVPTWFRGRTTIVAFLEQAVLAGKKVGDFRLVATRSNASPAFAVYARDSTGIYAASALHVLTIADDKIARIDDFLALNARLFSRLQLPVPD